MLLQAIDFEGGGEGEFARALNYGGNVQKKEKGRSEHLSLNNLKKVPTLPIEEKKRRRPGPLLSIGREKGKGWGRVFLELATHGKKTAGIRLGKKRRLYQKERSVRMERGSVILFDEGRKKKACAKMRTECGRGGKWRKDSP